MAMRLLLFYFATLAAADTARIVQSNDDGWAEMNIRTLNDALVAAGNNVVLSAPADNESGRGKPIYNLWNTTQRTFFSS